MGTVVVFFFKQKTAYEMRISDWSSDVCSSDLQHLLLAAGQRPRLLAEPLAEPRKQGEHALAAAPCASTRMRVAADPQVLGDRAVGKQPPTLGRDPYAAAPPLARR